jgi:threonine dehydrogenase-like Zn-dependent dehydrogenase
MKTKALRLYGNNDQRLESFELPEIKDNEILADVVTNSICMSDHKAVIQGKDHKRIPKDIAENPIILGHEQCGTILKVGDKLKGKFKVGTKYSIQPAVNYPGKESEAVGYSYQYLGGDATKVVIPYEVIEMDCVITYKGETFFHASLAEPVACIIAALKTQYHIKPKQYEHEMGLKKGGKVGILGGAGPMGLGFVDLLINFDKKASLIVVTDVDQSKLDRAASLFPPKMAAEKGIKLIYMNTGHKDVIDNLMALTGNHGLDDIFVMIPVPIVAEQASQLLAKDGCMNFFAGPSDKNFKANLNLYDVHYSGHHFIGSVGSNSFDMADALNLIGNGVINPVTMITHIGGLDSTAETILNLPNIPGGKKLIYTGISLPLTALVEFKEKGKVDPLFNDLYKIIVKTNGIWSKEAEDYLLKNAISIEQINNSI